MEELFDKELQGMVKFTDATQQATPKTEEKKAVEKNARQEKAVQKAKDKPVDAKWEHIPEIVKGDRNWLDRLKACAKWVALFGGLSMLFFYWQQTGQMDTSAAVPSMCVCTLLAGVGVGRNWWK